MITIDKEMAQKCATALVDKHNSIPQDMEHDACIIISFRSLYKDLCALGCSWMIASAIHPVNPHGFPLFD